MNYGQQYNPKQAKSAVTSAQIPAISFITSVIAGSLVTNTENLSVVSPTISVAVTSP